MTDAVVTYVNGSDAQWQAEWQRVQRSDERWANQQIDGSRWRDFGTLPLLIGGIRRYMPWVRNVYVVVSGESQVPCLEPSLGATIVYHRDIIPDELLPTFNSTVIELFLWRIKDISERFIYFNDDMFPVGPLEEDDFYDGERVRIRPVVKPPCYTLYSRHLKNGAQLACDVLGCRMDGTPIRFGHSATPMLRSTWRHLWSKASKELMASCTPFRSPVNINQEVSTFWHLYANKWTMSNRKTFYSTTHRMEEVERILREEDCQLLCVNDTKGTVEGVGERLKELLESNLNCNNDRK